MDRLVEHYNKFNEDKRLKSRHGEVEFRVSMKYIHKYLDEIENGLHPNLVKEIVNLFYSEETTPHHAQLICTTHDVGLMGAADSIIELEAGTRIN